MRSFITQGGQRQFLFRCLDFLLFEWKQAWDSLSVSNKMLNKLQAIICGKCGCSGSIEWSWRGFCSAKVQTSPLASTKESSTTFLESSPIPPRPILYLLLQRGKYCNMEFWGVMSILEHWPAQEGEERVGERALPASVELAPLPLPTSPQQYSECPQLMRKPVVQVQVGVDGVSFLTMQCSPILNDAVFQRKTLSSMFNSDIKKPTTSCLQWCFYRTQVSLGSDLWVRLSLTHWV